MILFNQPIDTDKLSNLRSFKEIVLNRDLSMITVYTILKALPVVYSNDGISVVNNLRKRKAPVDSAIPLTNKFLALPKKNNETIIWISIILVLMKTI